MCTTIFLPNFVHSVPSIMLSLRGDNSEFDQFSPNVLSHKHLVNDKM